MNRFKILLLVLIALVQTSAYALVPTVAEEDLYPSPTHERATKIIKHIIESYHYKKIDIDDELSKLVLKKYLENLDLNKSFFIQEDIDAFSRFELTLDDAIKKSDLSPAFEIFRKYRQRVDERVSYALNILESDFDFEREETYLFDRRDANWAQDTDELDEIWRKRIKHDILNLKLSKKKPENIKDTLQKRYERMRINSQQLDANDIHQAFINAFTTSIDPHTAYFSPRNSENFDISMRLSLEGIGAVLRNENEHTVIQRVIPGGPADLSGLLKADDKIIGVGQGKEGEVVDVIGWRLDDVVDLIRGPKGTSVQLEILPKIAGADGQSKVINLTRDKIKLEEQAAKSSIIEIEDTHSKIGIIELPTFYIDFAAQARGDKNYKSTSRDVRILLKQLMAENIDGLIIDLRGNGGGSLAEALQLTGLFIKEGPIVQTKDASGRVEINEDPDPSILYGGPLAVLVDRDSASASEIFAGAIQDYQRGIIIGEPTFGKGTVQNIVDLNRFVRDSKEDHGKLKTTIAQFFRISGGSNQHKGVIPDIVFPTLQDLSDHGERSLDNALPWDRVDPAKYIKVSAPVESFNMVQQIHEDRINTDKSFKLMLEGIKLVEEVSDKKVATLVESKRMEERERLNNSQREIKNQLRMLHGLEPLGEEDVALDTESKNQEEEDEDKIDVILDETAQILNDLILHSTDRLKDLHAIKTREAIISKESM